MAKKITEEEAKILKALVKFKKDGVLSADIKLTPEYKQAIKDTGGDIKRGYTLREAAEVIGVTYRTALGYIEEGRLKAHKVGGKWAIDKADLENFLR